MARRIKIPKTRVYVECTDVNKRIKGKILMHTDNSIRVELPTGFIMELTKKNQKNLFVFHIGLLEFICDGKLVH